MERPGRMVVTSAQGKFLLEEDGRFAVPFFPPRGEWGSVDNMARKFLYVTYFQW